MKRILTILLAMSAIIVLTSSKPIRVACIGDSITYGACIEDRANDAPPAVLQQMLGSGYEVRNFGFSARVMLQNGDHPYMKEKMYQDMKEFRPDIVTIMLGTNDSKPHNWKYSEEFEKDYITMVDELRVLPTKPKIYVCLPPKPFKDSFGINDSTIVAGVIPVIRKVADRRWLNIVDTYSTLDGRGDAFVADGIHPNPVGARMLAEEIYKVMEVNGDTGRQGLRVVFIGDSITDGDYGKADGKQSEFRNEYDKNHVYGHSYMSMVATRFLARYPEKRYTFYNRGIGGDRLKGLEKRWQKDIIDLHPDIVSILIGVNDLPNEDPDNYDWAGWEQTYRSLLDRTLAANPDTKFVLGTPFLAKVGASGRAANYDMKKAAVERFATIVRGIGEDYGAIVLPYDKLIAGLISSDKSGNEKYWTWDGIHPTYPAHSKMADLWIKSTRKLFR